MMTKNFQPPTQEEIARYAYSLWETEGRIHGRDLDYWLQAEAHLVAARKHETSEPVTLQEIATKKPQTITASVTPPVSPKLPRRRQSRSIREAVYA